MITLLHAPEAKRSTHSIKNLLDILGVRSFREIDVEDLKDLKTLSLGNSSNHELNTTTLIAPFYCLESLC